MNVRSIGSVVTGMGVSAQVAGYGLDGWMHSNDPNLAGRESVLTLTNTAHLLVYLGFAAVIIGLVAIAVGPRLYRRLEGDRPSHRLAKAAAPACALFLVAGGGIAANASSLGATHSHDHANVTTEQAMDHTHGMDHGSTDTTAPAGDGSNAGAMDHTHGMDHGSSDNTATDVVDTSAGAMDHSHGMDHANAVSNGSASSAHSHDSTASGAHDHTDPTMPPMDHTHVTDPAADPAADHAADPTMPPMDHTHVTDPGATDPHAGQCTNGSHNHGAAPPVALDPTTQAQLDAQLAQTRLYAVQFPTAKDAKAAGYVQVTHYLCGIGAHYLKISLLDDVFDPAKPEILLYDSDGPDAKLVGVNFYVRKVGSEPDGFVGPNDHWHQHIGLCLRIFFVIGPESWTDAQCKAAGGYKQPNSDQFWLLHAWVVPGWELPDYVFSPTHPNLPPGPFDVPHLTL